MPRLLGPSWRWITISGTPSRAISTAWAWRSRCSAKRRRTPARGGGALQLRSSRGGRPGRPRVVPLMTQSSEPTGSSRRTSSQGWSCSVAGVESRQIAGDRRRPAGREEAGHDPPSGFVERAPTTARSPGGPARRRSPRYRFRHRAAVRADSRPLPRMSLLCQEIDGWGCPSPGRGGWRSRQTWRAR